MVKNLTYLFVANPSRVASSSGTTTRKSLIILPGAENIMCNVSIDSCELCVKRVSFASCPKTVLLCMLNLYNGKNSFQLFVVDLSTCSDFHQSFAIDCPNYSKLAIFEGTT